MSLHNVALGGVYTKDGEILRFHDVSAPSSFEMQRLLGAIMSRVLRCLEHDGLLIRDPEQPWLDLESRDALDALGAASIQYRIAAGPHASGRAGDTEARGGGGLEVAVHGAEASHGGAR